MYFIAAFILFWHIRTFSIKYMLQ